MRRTTSSVLTSFTTMAKLPSRRRSRRPTAGRPRCRPRASPRCPGRRRSSDVAATPARRFGGCGAPATRSQTTRGCDALRSRPSGLKLSGSRDLRPAICVDAASRPRSCRASSRAARSSCRDRRRPGPSPRWPPPDRCRAAVTALTRWRVRRFRIRSPVAVSNSATPSPRLAAIQRPSRLNASGVARRSPRFRSKPVFASAAPRATSRCRSGSPTGASPVARSRATPGACRRD